MRHREEGIRGPAAGPGPCQRRGWEARGAARRGRTGRSCGGRGGRRARAEQAGLRWGRGAGAGPRRRRARLAPDLTFWVRACVQEARRGRGWGREAVREVPGWLAGAPFSLPHLPAPEGTGPQGPQAGSGRGPPGRLATVTPRARGHFSLGPPGAAGGGGQGLCCAQELPAPRPPPLRGVPEAPLPRSGVGRSLVNWSLPLPPPPSGFRGLRDRGAGIGDPSALHRPGAGPGLTLSGSVTGRGNFPKPGTEPEHPPPPPRPLIPLPLHLLQRLPLPPTRILLRVTDGTVSQSKAGN